jgi:multidrug resistance efflux pump
VAGSEADFAVASIRANDAALHYANLGAALETREQLSQQGRELRSQASSLQLDSPVAGTVLTPRLGDLLGANVPAGTELVEVADLRQMRARVFVSEYDLYKFQVGALARLNILGSSKLWAARAVTITPASSEIHPGIAERTQYKGFNPLNFYVVELSIANPENILKPGMVGDARIYGQRRSLIGHLGREIVRFFGRKVW